MSLENKRFETTQRARFLFGMTVAVVGLVCLCLSWTVAASQPAHQALVILDLRDASKSLNRVLTFPDGTSKGVAELKSKLDAARTNDEVVAAVVQARKLLGIDSAGQAAGDQATRVQSDRWLATTGDALHVYVVYERNKKASTDAAEPVTIDIQEAVRDTRLAQDLATALKIASAVKAAAELEAALYSRDYVLTKARATLTVTAALRPSSGDKQGDVEHPSREVKATLITGPREHFFLSADLPITKATQLSYDDQTHELTSKDVPTTFYFAVDYTLGDILSAERTLWEGITLKAMFKISKNPLDSYGCGIGYRLRNTKLSFIELDAFSPFVAVLWTKQDAVNAAGQPALDSEYHANFRVGLTFNLDKALEWLKK